MNAKKRLQVLFVAVMVLSLATISAFAGSDSGGVPSDAIVYGAGTCRYGFTTSRYLTGDSETGWRYVDVINVSNTYVLWDDVWHFDMYELVYAKDDDARVTPEKRIFSGTYNLRENDDDWIANPGTNRNNYTPYIDGLDFECDPSGKIYLRITKPSVNNYDDGQPVENMKVWGYFWK